MTSRLETVLETPRLVLRVPSLAELEPWCAFMGDAEAARYIGTAQPPAVVWRSIATIVGAWHLVGFGMFSVFEKTSGRWIGRVGPWEPLGWPGHEVGWGLAREAWGRGYAFEAAAASIDFAVDVLGWSDIVHLIHPDNVRSQKVAARLGSTRRGASRLPPPYDADPVDVWGQTASAWNARRNELWARLGR